jgi:hypothetical protein
MSLLTTLSDGGERKSTTNSTVSTSPPDDHEEVNVRNRHHLPPNTSWDHQHVQSSYRGSEPASPNSEKAQFSNARGERQPRPPGLSGPLPSPIAASSSPALTLTPNSSVDGHSDWNSVGKQASPYDAPSLPFLHPEHHRSQGSYGSIDFTDANDDGLLGLGALRDRALSSPGVSSSGPPAARGHLSAHAPPHHQQQHQHRMDQQDRPRARDRPPRSQPYEAYGNYQQGDRSEGGYSAPYSSSGSRGDPNNLSLDSSDWRSYGAIARPELRQSASEFDPSRMRSSSVDNYQPPYAFQQQGGPPEQFAQKFGSLPTLGAHLQQQRAPDNFSTHSKPRHVRSVSQPVPAGFGSAQQQLPPGMDPRYYGSSIPSSRHQFSMAGPAGVKESGSVPRSSNMAQSIAYDNSRYKGNSMPNLGGYQQQAGYSTLQRRDALDFHISPHGSQSSGSVIAAQEEMRAYGVPGMISPGLSPLQAHYGNHSRQPSDSGVTMLSSSPLSMGSGVMRGPGPGSIHGRHAIDEDLVGEHIEVPADHDDHGMHASYMMNTGGSHPLLRGPTHVHAMSMDQIPTQFMEVPHHLPTAGAALPMPKVIYSVKFKRTQRNFVLGPRINRDLKVGTYIKVEADRGEDLGIVIGKTSADKFGFSGRASFTAGMGPSPGVLGGASPADLKRIIRLATHDEVSLLSLKREEEEELLKICRAKVHQRGLPMHVVDAEYQFDRHKLTFFFEAECRIDFRELVRDLFSIYKTRIWMQQLDKNTSTSAPAIVSPQAANLQMDYGTPIIAPVSEFADSIVLNGLSGGDVRSL